jgi:2-polyprenyl-3-methyl-5-hydroxy-6-metoxy-1,4-benzoquinol methylase
VVTRDGPNYIRQPQAQLESLRRMSRARSYNAWLLDRARPYLGTRVLDVGAGTGTFTEQLALDKQVVALEPDAELFRILSGRLADRANVTLFSYEVQSLPASLSLELFDSVVCFNVLEHIPDDMGALRSFHERLAPGGHALLLVPAHPVLFGPLDVTVAHQRRYDKAGLQRSLEAAAFEPVVLRYVNPIGALGWLISGRILRRDQIPEGPLGLFDRLVPLLRRLDEIDLGFGLSLWGVARRA